MYKEQLAEDFHPETATDNPERSRPLIIAHRGASSAAPENTLAAFTRAIEEGANGVEFDVRLSKDGVPVVHHDPTLRRTAGVDIKISELTSEALGDVEIGSWFRQVAPSQWRAEYERERIPTFTATLEHLKNFHGLIYVELKSEPGQDIEQLVHAVCQVIRESPIADRLIVKSFRLSFIPHLRARCPGLRSAALFAPKIMTILRKEKHLVDLAVEFGADELSVHYSLATKKLIKKAARRGLPVTVWTVDHARWLRRSVKLGVDRIITNDPARMIAHLEEYRQK